MQLKSSLTLLRSEPHHFFFNLQFCRWGESVPLVHIKLPNTPVAAGHVLGLYEWLGLLRCIGSVECDHMTVWDKCPAGILSACKGKGNIPTLVFEVVCSHTRKIMSVSQLFWGTINQR